MSLIMLRHFLELQQRGFQVKHTTSGEIKRFKILIWLMAFAPPSTINAPKMEEEAMPSRFNLCRTDRGMISVMLSTLPRSKKIWAGYRNIISIADLRPPSIGI